MKHDLRLSHPTSNGRNACTSDPFHLSLAPRCELWGQWRAGSSLRVSLEVASSWLTMMKVNFDGVRAVRQKPRSPSATVLKAWPPRHFSRRQARCSGVKKGKRLKQRCVHRNLLESLIGEGNRVRCASLCIDEQVLEHVCGLYIMRSLQAVVARRGAPSSQRESACVDPRSHRAVSCYPSNEPQYY